MAALGIVLFVLGLGLVIAEFFTGTYVLFGLGALFAVLGLIFWGTSGTSWFEVNWWVVILLLLVLGILLFWIVYRIRCTSRRQVTTGTEELIGKIATVKEDLDPEGTVNYQGDLWNAVSRSGTIPTGAQVIICKVDNLTLEVTPRETNQKS